ncbi:hypothetical protein M5E87_12130 [Flavonifractor plautii]|nr:hypothetical protein M5E87_12130 [Flavonifractor plautii]
MEALHTVTYPTDSLITASYAADGDYVLYTYSCGVLTSVPAGATVLIQAAEQDSFIVTAASTRTGLPLTALWRPSPWSGTAWISPSLPTPSTTAPTSRTTTAM